MQYFAFKKASVDIFIARSTKDYPKNSAIIVTPNDFLYTFENAGAN